MGRRPYAFPAHAGIDLALRGSRRFQGRLPRARGDRPIWTTPRASIGAPSPRTRGSTRHLGLRACVDRAFPAHAGIDLSCATGFFGAIRLPRARGDRPANCIGCPKGGAPSPRTRGSTFGLRWQRRTASAFPAHAGIDPVAMIRYGPRSGLPRARGDRPARRLIGVGL